LKLIIQIPCYNEYSYLPETFQDLPRTLDGVDEIEVLVIDDGSRDGTAQLAQKLGVHHIVSFTKNQGLSAAYMAGLDACMRLGADIVVNTDADNQYKGSEIVKLVKPILDGRADIVIGDRQTDHISHFSFIKKLLQRWGSLLVQRASGIQVTDSTSGFRAFSRKSLYQLFVHNKFSYTLETIIQSANLGFAIENVKISCNPKNRESKLFSSIPQYLSRNGPVIFRSYSMYWPLKTFLSIALLFSTAGTILILRFFFYYFLNPEVSAHIQSLQIGLSLILIAFMLGLMAFFGDLIASNRRISEEVLMRLRRLEANFSQLNVQEKGVEGVTSTGAKAWRKAGK
jgi:glycosyltransferase involved in cell wall biosynthesis